MGRFSIVPRLLEQLIAKGTRQPRFEAFGWVSHISPQTGAAWKR
jgi:hypothetical protein